MHNDSYIMVYHFWSALGFSERGLHITSYGIITYEIELDRIKHFHIVCSDFK